MSNNLDDLYRDIIMDHYKYPRGKSKIADANILNEGKNPVCGDEIAVSLKVNGSLVEDISVNCMGCAISIASGSMLAETLKGKTIDEIKKIAKVVKAILKGEEPSENTDLGDLEALEGVRKFPVRIKCALLSWTTLIDGLEAWESENLIDTSSVE
ncbi:MAG: SUF system NifU family Fe-S cluster assembly protein [candidate division Zixibacteria bacterium]